MTRRLPGLRELGNFVWSLVPPQGTVSPGGHAWCPGRGARWLTSQRQLEALRSPSLSGNPWRPFTGNLCDRIVPDFPEGGGTCCFLQKMNHLENLGLWTLFWRIFFFKGGGHTEKEGAMTLIKRNERSTEKGSGRASS